MVIPLEVAHDNERVLTIQFRGNEKTFPRIVILIDVSLVAIYLLWLFRHLHLISLLDEKPTTSLS